MGARCVVLGVGNPIMGDDGVGLEILRALEEKWDMLCADSFDDEHGDSSCADRVDFVEGVTAGMELVPIVQEAKKLLILDAIEPSTSSSDRAYRQGECVNISGDQVPRLLSTKMSPHQVGLLDVLTACRLLGEEPDEVRVIGIVPVSVDLRVGLSAGVRASVPEAVCQALRILEQWCDDPQEI